MEMATASGAPSLWGPPTTLTSFLLQAFACPAPWSPNYIPPGIRSSFISAGLPLRPPPLTAPQEARLQGPLRAFIEIVNDCTLTATTQQYQSILTFGSYNKFEKPALVELLACITLIAVSIDTGTWLDYGILRYVVTSSLVFFVAASGAAGSVAAVAVVLSLAPTMCVLSCGVCLLCLCLVELVFHCFCLCIMSSDFSFNCSAASPLH